MKDKKMKSIISVDALMVFNVFSSFRFALGIYDIDIV
jgi:hypothetical protein